VMLWIAWLALAITISSFSRFKKRYDINRSIFCSRAILAPKGG
jgi:hypothetical protein